MRTYNCLFKMPKDEQLFVAAYAAISTYEKKLRNLKLPFQIFLLTKENWLTDLIVSSMNFIVESLDDVSNIHFDMAIDLKDEDAIAIGKSGKHAAQAFGFMMGLTEVTELVVIPPEEIKYDLCIIPWSTKSIELINSIRTRFPDITFNDTEATRSRIVCGCRSIATYISACMNKSVLELYTLEDYPKEFLSKWSNHQYRMLCVEKKEAIDANHHIIWRALEQKINGIVQGQSRNKPI